jgi:hypothetical protein
MFDWLRYRYELARLERLKRKTTRSYDRALNDAADNHKMDEAEALLCKEEHEIAPLNDLVAKLVSDRLIAQGKKYLIPVPMEDLNIRLGKTESENWKVSLRTYQRYLTPSAIVALRSTIRAERKERTELAFRWLTALTGLIGVLIGLLAIILGRR